MIVILLVQLVIVLLFLFCFLSHSSPENFAEKLVLKLVASFSSHCLAYELNLTRRLFKGRVVHSVQLQMQIENIIFKSWGMHRKHEMVSWF